MSFMCESCCEKAKVADWFMPVSYGRCEDCGKAKSCADIPSGFLRRRQELEKPNKELSHE